MAIERVNGVLAGMGGGTDQWSLDHSGECVLEREDGGECVINAPAEGSAFTLSAVVGFVHQQDTDSLLAGLLQINSDPTRTMGGSVGLDESGEVIVYRYVVDSEGLAGLEMMSIISNFFTLTDKLRKEISTMRKVAEKGAVRSLRRRPGVHGYLRA